MNCRFLTALGMTVVLGASSIARAQVLAELRGHVTDARTARPIADARIEIIGRSESVRSGADGSFTLRGLEPRTYTVRVRAIGYIARDADVELANGRATTLELALDGSPIPLGAVAVRASRNASPANTATFDRRAIEASGKRDVGELLETVPGIVITQAGGPGSESHASIRGSGANEVLVLVDGAPLNSPITGEADLSRLPLGGVERVVVRQGTQAARYGARAMAGVIEVETRRPARDASVVARAGAWGEQSASVSLGDARPVGAMRGGGSISADYRTLRGDFTYAVPDVRGGGSARRVNGDVASRALAAAFSLDGSEGNAAIRGSFETLNRGIAGSIVQPSLTGREANRRQSAGIDAAWQPLGIVWAFAGDVTHEQSTYADPSPPFGVAYRDTVAATGLTASSTVTAGTEPLSASIGGEVRTTDVSSTMLVGAPRWQRDWAAFGDIRMTRRLGTGGTRADLDAAARLDQGNLTTGTTVSPRLAASISRGIFVTSASVGSGFAPPSLADQFFHEGVLVRPNPNLRPERTRNDIDVRLGVRDVEGGPLRLSAEAAAFRADVDGMILWLPDYRFIWSPSNYDVRRSGWEGNVLLAIRDAVDVHAALNRTDVAYAGPVLTGQVAYRPRTSGTLTFGAGPRAARLEIANRYVGARRTVPASGLNALDPYWRTDVRLRAEVERRAWSVDVTLGVENILNTNATMLVDYPFPSRSWTLGFRIRRLDHERGP
jgi:vitamin B12 transporter